MMCTSQLLIPERNQNLLPLCAHMPNPPKNQNLAMLVTIPILMLTVSEILVLQEDFITTLIVRLSYQVSLITCLADGQLVWLMSIPALAI